MKHFLLIAIVLLSTSVFSQSVLYNDSDLEGRIEKNYEDGSILMSYIENREFYLDSISPYGDDFPVMNFIIQDSGDLDGYYYDDSLGLFVVNVVPDTLAFGGCELCTKTHVVRYDFSGAVNWEITQKLGVNGRSNFELFIARDSIVVFGHSWQEGDCSPDAFYHSFSFNGIKGTGKQVGSCTTKRLAEFDDGVYFQPMRRCWCGDSHFGATKISRLESNNTLTTLAKFEKDNHPFFSDDARATHVDIIDENFFFGSISEYYSNARMFSIIEVEDTNQIWHNLNPLYGISKYSGPLSQGKKVFDVVKYDDGFLVLFGRQYTSNLQDTIGTRYDSTELQIDYVNDEVTFNLPMWKKSFEGKIEVTDFRINERTGEISAYVNHNTRTGTSVNGNYNEFLMHIEFDDQPSTFIEDKKVKSALEVIPNPAKNFIQLKGIEQGDYKICNVNGAVIKRGKLRGGLKRISVQQLKSGFYVVDVTSGSDHYRAKLIVE
ncbi:T9SS type A sorting domain-containing protein [Salibacter halophilus]|uniref:T9SS type A sorting domain-containing protein n=1 Tax=Salibacter halophilus TaxID=1803916 RepID=A0A6N6M301_9FLAO|nr:T9SS type A sorting domain-containing protein [Salibacter halophilus]KAB1063466.1 T9SS type A sorting domain-containing protein [Salibacter halophilus]